ncbi:Cytochrome b561 and DOMON domain-containing protein [Hibiscus syriacus]|uniref:Cytochrome b561 and DOMON domain-containing protein n=1 Tax=Hibiscus syriacus TaxID=106335 RepID=A0A6A3AEX2_HIBSY|nr:Cytochrome b561 and DOMON domain-containing protein [Hibiscus syriacus]
MLQYVQTSSNVWSFVLSAPDTNSYIAIGFSSGGMMVGSSSMVGWISADGSGTVKQYFIGGQRPNLVLPDQSNLTLVSNSSSITSRSSRLYMAFQLNTTQPLSRLIYSVGQISMIPSSPSYALAKHRDKVSTTLNYVKEPWSTKYAELGDTDDNRSNDCSVLQAMGSDLVLLPLSDSVVRPRARDGGCNMRTCFRKSSQNRSLHPQRPRHLHTCAGMPPVGNRRRMGGPLTANGWLEMTDGWSK